MSVLFAAVDNSPACVLAELWSQALLPKSLPQYVFINVQQSVF